MKVFSNRAIRLLLALSVSIWMAGGCLLGCANTTMASKVSQDSQRVEAGAGCHAKRSHEPERKQHGASNFKQQLASVPSFMPVPNDMMNECPLVVNSTAATSKNSTHLPDPARGAIAALPSFEKQTEQTDNTVVVSFLPNRGPTHLRCCVFLI